VTKAPPERPTESSNGSSRSASRTIGQGGTLNHLGVEVENTVAVDTEQTRLAEQGLATVDQRDSTCCYAIQDKIWVQNTPNSERWEIYTVLADSPTFFENTDKTVEAACCANTGTHAGAPPPPAADAPLEQSLSPDPRAP
jgi:hypothetical protein